MKCPCKKCKPYCPNEVPNTVPTFLRDTQQDIEARKLCQSCWDGRHRLD